MKATHDYAARIDYDLWMDCLNILRGKWRAREEISPPRWPETSMILPPTESRGKSNVRPFVRPQLSEQAVTRDILRVSE